MCGRLLVAPRDKKSRRSYQCTEFAVDLHSVFGIDTHNDAVNIHPSNYVIVANKLWIEHNANNLTTQLVHFLMSGRDTLLRNARFDQLPTEHVRKS